MVAPDVILSAEEQKMQWNVELTARTVTDFLARSRSFSLFTDVPNLCLNAQGPYQEGENAES
jgi:hypothetical protein